jgi:eukaryotic-like serine/threonine-protein kinase
MSLKCPRCNSSLLAPDAVCGPCLLSAPPEPFAGLELYEELGRGGMGTVYRARHLKLDREVAVKFLAPQLAANPDVRERFTREAAALARINHPNVVRVFDAGIEEGEAFIVLEHLPGGTLAGLPPQSVERAVGLAVQVCAALEAVHAAGLVHRDVKPENVLLAHDGTAKLSDFGIVRFADGSHPATQTGLALGTPGFAAPEVLAGKRADARGDVYAVGALLKQLVHRWASRPTSRGVSTRWCGARWPSHPISGFLPPGRWPRRWHGSAPTRTPPCHPTKRCGSTGSRWCRRRRWAR